MTIPLHEPGRMLREKILQGLNLSPSISTSDNPSSSSSSSLIFDSSGVRLISRGKVIKDDEDIERQGLRNGSVVMVLIGTTLEVGKRVVRWIWTIAGGNDAPVLTNASFLFFLSTPFFLPPFSSHLYSLLSFPPRFPSFLPSYFFFPRPFLLFRCVLASL